MKLAKILGAASVVTLISATASLANTVTVDLSSFLQITDVANSATSTSSVTSVLYSLGAAGDGIATWDTGTGGGVASDFLSDPTYFQTVTWSGLSLGAGLSTTFGSLDIDLIETLAPLSVTGGVLDEVGTSLANAFVTVNWADGSFGTASLAQSAWRDDQQLSISSVAAVPLPAAFPMLLLGMGVLGGVAARRRRT